MKTSLQALDGSAKEEIELPKIFAAPYRPDLIQRVYVCVATHNLQRQGRNPEAGERTSAESWGVGRGASRVPRVRGKGGQRSSQAAGAASIVGGRIPHPPKAETTVRKEVNQKERRLAIASAIAATAQKEIVSLRGHKVDGVNTLPIVVVDDVEKLSRTKDLLNLLAALNLTADLERAAGVRKARSGKAQMRGRGARSGRGPLIVVSNDQGIGKAVGNLPGVEYVLARNLTITHLAPGSHAGRLVVWSRSALESLPKPLLEVGEAIAA
ncbi:MAG: 50S ribosomal protein L4 [Thaumarchaeota archaeon]|nr:50S ribosomal protein L4 [Nitrososphaerota archaeon]MCL5318011.1 50S ribosomal protein L4 [Nitrososphaerota archaeon]